MVPAPYITLLPTGYWHAYDSSESVGPRLYTSPYPHYGFDYGIAMGKTWKRAEEKYYEYFGER